MDVETERELDNASPTYLCVGWNPKMVRPTAYFIKMDTIKFGILTVSDTCFNQVKEDTSGPKLQEEVKKYFPGSTFYKKTVPDEVITIKETLKSWATYGCDIILTTGGTGLSPRDVTPEATRAVIDREVPGISAAMITRSLAVTDLAMLSRAVCGTRGKTLIVNLPGSAKAAVECFGFIKSCIPHAVALLSDKKELVANLHQQVQATTAESKVKLENIANRNRESPYPMLAVEDAIKIILDECQRSLEVDIIPFDKSMYRILAQDVYASAPVPPFPASIKDGYAVRAHDGVGEKLVRNVVAAGDKPCEEELKEGEVIRISTGAPIPAGADAVVQVENTTLLKTSVDGYQEEYISIDVAPTEGQDIRAIGSDVEENSLVLHKYDKILPAHLGVLAMLGKTEVKVFKRKSIGILSTGNELKQPGEPLKPGQICDSNKYTLMSLLKRYSYDSMDCGTAKRRAALEKAFSSHDIVITTGGVSMGEHDLIKQVLEQDFDALIHFGRVNMKPGKPTTFATLSYGGKFKIFFGLPGNPVSCGVTCILFVLPVLRYLERSKSYKFPVVEVSMNKPLVNNEDRPEYHRVSIFNQSGRLWATSTGNQTSSRLNSLCGCEWLNYSTEKTACRRGLSDAILFDEILNL
ncbi:hypothetical protein NQ317_012150 [Molorchus minor]|uniref:MoaB/Mog domain-containing protein n=1 Tax=Molorchus minor TaxID=1323400 RepID=A0ABQ9JLX2_9CUCU|nr:hypothetical protein NQ317_012150 [Molorchus minor]